MQTNTDTMNYKNTNGRPSGRSARSCRLDCRYIRLSSPSQIRSQVPLLAVIGSL